MIIPFLFFSFSSFLPFFFLALPNWGIHHIPISCLCKTLAPTHVDARATPDQEPHLVGQKELVARS